jgi:hypothetical protein
METNMLEMKTFMSSMILHELDETLPKGDIKMQGNKDCILE